ncbi:MAG: molybdate ABC transporter substrate-binding protein [Acidobacteriota bacterium]
MFRLSLVGSLCGALVAILLGPSPAVAEQALVAVAANFTTVAEQLVEDFESSAQHSVALTTGSTGKLYAQLRHGAPYDVFLAADQERPRLLVESGLVADGGLFTYARGRLVLWGADLPAAPDWDSALEIGEARRIALANPELAPYGAAARSALEAGGHWRRLQAKLVFGENVGQAFSMVASGSAQLGLLARSSVVAFGGPSGHLVPESLHQPIRQDAVLLRRAQGNAAARAFFEYLKSPAAQRRLLESGYELP